MQHVLGIDGGGTKTVCLVADEGGRLRGYGRGGPVNTNYVARQEAVASLAGAIQAALQEAGLDGEHIQAACISAPMSPDAVQEVAGGCGIRHIVRAAEGETPRWAARFWIEERVGVTVDAGTGSMARGWSEDGRQAGASGWGATLGDEGSGYWISIKAMTAILQAYDGRIPETRLTRPTLEHFGMSDVLDMVFRVSQGLVWATDAGQQVRIAPDSGAESSQPAEVATAGVLLHRHSARRGPLTRCQVASLCPVVVGVARQGDWKAIQILKEAGVELGRAGAAVIHRLGMEKSYFAVVPFGGVFRAGELVLDSFRETILAVAPQAMVVRPRFEPVVGAVLLALDSLGATIDARITSAIEHSSLQFPACRVD
ncbi:MAG: BadF/BadG/BcrA/BcrD ATPase family protein [Anaerolineae bacterium]